jgi:hypothetical protein
MACVTVTAVALPNAMLCMGDKPDVKETESDTQQLKQESGLSCIGC